MFAHRSLWTTHNRSISRHAATPRRPRFEQLESRQLLSTVINFDALPAAGQPDGVSGAALTDYLAQYGVTLSNANAQVVVYDAREIYPAIQPVVPPSPYNVIGQTGSLDSNSYELDFAQSQSSFSLTRPLIRAGTTGIVLPEWHANAYDSSGRLLATAGESLVGTYVDEPAQTFTLNGPGIHSVVIESNSYHFAAFGAMVFDDFVIDSLPDLAVTPPTWNTASGGVDFGYTISGANLAQPTTAALYWSADTTFDPNQDTLIPGSVTDTQTAGGTYGPIHVDAATLGTPPSGAHYLLAVVDPDSTIAESDETNNVQALVVDPFTVTNTLDSGLGSLRQAILNANEHPGTDTITFQIGSGVQTIIPISSLPTITDPLVIDATTQPGFSGVPIIEIDGASAGTFTDGLTITAGNTTIKGLVINRFGLSAINIYSGGNDVIQGNYIGTDTTGTLAEPNGWGQTLAVNDAIVISSSSNTIGGTTAAERNVISGNAIDGVLVFGGSSDLILGNDIGTDASGTHNLGNAYSGIRIEGSNNTIGGSVSGAGNVIAGNKQYGIFVTNGSPGTVIQGNKIGTDVTGNVAIGNVGYGVHLATSVYDNTIGGTAVGAGNVIAYNGSTGVFIGQPDQGLPLPGTGNAVLGNSIFANGGLGIDLGRSVGLPDGPNSNDTGDPDTGPNDLQNYPILTSAVTDSNGTIVQGTLNSAANTTFRIELFSNTANDSTGYGEGQQYLGFVSVTTDALGNATFQTTLSSVPAGRFLSATATDPGNNTSEFSRDLVVSPPATASATFLKQDATTSGNWVGTYGANGYDSLGYTASLPSYATVTPANDTFYTWASSTTDTRALQNPANPTGSRVAACWYSTHNTASFTVDVNISDGQAHDLALYFLDWPNSGRSETVQLSDAATGTVLDTESVSSFRNGVYLQWKISGNVLITITKTAGSSAVLSGLFFDSAPAAAATATFVGKNAPATKAGNWVGTYGAEGYDALGYTASLPSYATVTPANNTYYVWASSTTDTRALQNPANPGGSRVAACWYSTHNTASFTVDVNITDGQAHDLALYFLDWPNSGRSETVQLSDAATGTVLDTETISSLGKGVYLQWKISGNVLITITKTAGSSAVLSGLFFDSAIAGMSIPGGPALVQAGGIPTQAANSDGASPVITGSIMAVSDRGSPVGPVASSPDNSDIALGNATIVDPSGKLSHTVPVSVTTQGPRPDGHLLQAAARRLARQPSDMVRQPRFKSPRQKSPRF